MDLIAGDHWKDEILWLWAEFSTLMMAGDITYNFDEAILYVFDDAVLQPNLDVEQEVFDAMLEKLKGKERDNYILQNTHKKTIDDKIVSAAKFIDLTGSPFSSDRGVVCVGGPRKIQTFLANNLPKQLTETTEDKIANDARDKLMVLLNQFVDEWKKEEAKKKRDDDDAKETKPNGERRIYEIDLGKKNLFYHKIHRREVHGIAAKEEVVLKWMDKIFGKSKSDAKNWKEDELKKELNLLSQQMPKKYDNFYGKFQAVILCKNVLIHLKPTAEGQAVVAKSDKKGMEGTSKSG